MSDAGVVRRTRERLFWMVAVVVAGAIGAAGAAWHAATPARPASHDHTRAHQRPSPADIERVVAVNAGTLSAAKPCRQGAFVEAIGIVGSAVEIHRALPASTAERTRAELDTVLYTALKQARGEVHCVAGVITHGYDRAYVESIRRGIEMARERGLSPDIAAIGGEVIDALRGPAKAPAVN